MPVNVLLVSVDTLRADRLGCYGYPKDTTPGIDRFSEDAVLFEQAIAQGPSTLVSHASLLTSLWVDQHGASFGDKRAVPDDVVTLAEVLKAAGYRTASFNGGGQLDAVFGLDQGFEVYQSVASAKFWSTIKPLLKWLEQDLDAPFFAFLHTYEVHHPYRPQPELLDLVANPYQGALPGEISKDLLDCINQGERAIDAADLEYISSTYDAELRSVDAMFGDLMTWLKEHGLYDDTLIVLTSDHGEEFGEHGIIGMHSHTLYDELLRVPALVKLPRSERRGARLERPIRSIDLAPSILDLAGLGAAPSFEGQSLLPLIEASPAGVHATRELAALSTQDGTGVEAIRTPDWKLFGAQLFDLHLDPGEQLDVASRNPEVVAELRKLRETLLPAGVVRRGPAAIPGAAAAERLRSLGYIN